MIFIDDDDDDDYGDDGDDGETAISAVTNPESVNIFHCSDSGHGTRIEGLKDTSLNQMLDKSEVMITCKQTHKDFIADGSSVVVVVVGVLVMLLFDEDPAIR